MESRYDPKTKFSAIDALGCKLSATRLGYYDDDLLQFFEKYVKNSSRRIPIINRGDKINL
jgi:hypothetical protein